MIRKQNTRLATVLLSIVLAVIVGCGPAAAPAAQSAAPTGTAAATAAATATPIPVTKLNVRMGFTWAVAQYYSMFLLGKDKGFFSKRGLDVDLSEGQGGATVAQLIANNQADVAIAVDPASVIRADVSGAKLRMVAQTLPIAPLAVLSKASAPIKTPQDLVGKKIGLPPGTTQSQMFPAFLKAVKLDASSMNIINTPNNVIQQALAQGQIDAYVSFAHSQPAVLRGLGIEPATMLLSDFGLKYAPGEGVIFRDDFIAAKPDVVKAFVAAVEESLQYGADHPDEAAAAGVKAHPEAMKQDVATTQNQIVGDILKKNRASGKPFTFMTDADFKNLIQLLTDYADLKGAGNTTDYYTNSYVPAS